MWTHSLSEYQRVVSALAQDDVRLAALRNKTMQARSTGPLFKTTRIVREVEYRIVQMVREYEAGGTPRALEEAFPPAYTRASRRETVCLRCLFEYAIC